MRAYADPAGPPPAGTQYAYRVRAVRGGVTSDWSATSGAVGTAVPTMNLTAYRTGSVFGTALSEADENSNDPNRYVILLNNDIDEDNGTADDPQVDARDNADATALLRQGAFGAAPDDDLARVFLAPIGNVDQGTVKLIASDPSAVKLFRNDGTQVDINDLVLDLADPTGPLGGLLRTGVDLWAEATTQLADLKLSLVYEDAAGAERAKDEVHALVTKPMIAVDNDRDETIKLDGSDATSKDKPYLFWLNDNRDVWGGEDYHAATSGPSNLPKDSDTLYLGSTSDDKGNSIAGNDAAIREVAMRDMEDMFQIGIVWPQALDGPDTRVRVRLASQTSSAMKVRVFPSSLKAGAQDGTFSASLHVDDDAAITSILTRNGTNEPATLGVGQSKLFAPLDSSMELNGYGVGIMPNGDRLLQLMIEGVARGDGQLVVELVKNGQVLASSTTDLRLRPMSEMYDHYSVARPPNVNADGTYAAYKTVDPLDMTNPVLNVPRPVAQNQERGRSSADYFMFVHGWRLQEWERLAFAETSYKRLFWSGYTGQFGTFTWPTQWVEDPVEDAGNYDRSEFLAWNSATGLANALKIVRYAYTDYSSPDPGKLSVMAHSMGNVVLAEALYQNQALGAGGTKLVDTAIMSQAALSGDYFEHTGALPSVYKPHAPDHNGSDPVQYHIDQRVTTNMVGSNFYKGFRPGLQNLDVIGGLTPRFRDINLAAGQILNYYNPDDYALASWRLGQALKPTSEWSDPVNALNIKGWVDYGNVDLAGGMAAGWTWKTGEDIPGFAETEYDIVDAGQGEYQLVRRYTGGTDKADKVLTYAANKYEMFAFGASSVVAPLGALAGTVFSGVFNDERNLPGLSTNFNNKNTGHSAQFVHSFADVRSYWEQVKLAL